MIGRSAVLILGWTTLLTEASAAGALPTRTFPSIQDAAPEADIKAAFLHNFARFAEWPDSHFPRSTEEFRMGVLGSADAADALQKLLKDKRIAGRALKILRGQVPADLKACAMVYVTAPEKDQIPRLLEEFKALPILTVGETEGFAQSGGILNFYIDQNKVKFEINPDAASRAGLKVTRLVGVAPRKIRER